MEASPEQAESWTPGWVGWAAIANLQPGQENRGFPRFPRPGGVPMVCYKMGCWEPEELNPKLAIGQHGSGRADHQHHKTVSSRTITDQCWPMPGLN